MESKPGIFLEAEWRKLLFINYEVDPEILKPYLPKHTELDFFEDICLVSLVGFMFNNTKIKGIRFPFHTDFEEFNLRFYVKHKSGDEYKRGVVFVSELVPKFLIPLIANTVYRENYRSCPMSSKIKISDDILSVSYSFKIKDNVNTVSVEASGNTEKISSGSIEEFITEHYWGYNKWNSKATMEYGVEHPKWEIYPIHSHNVNCRYENIYPLPFVHHLYSEAHSCILAEGSNVIVREGRIIKA